MYRAAPEVFNINNFYMGLDWTSHPSNVNLGWLIDAKNMNLNSYRALEKRRGCALLRAVPYTGGAAIHSLFEYSAPGPPATKYLLVGSGTELGAWSGSTGEEWAALKTGLTSGTKINFAVHDGYCYCVNGVDHNFKLYNMNMYENVGIAAPATAPEVAVDTGTNVNGHYKWVYAYLKDTYPTLISNPSPASAVLECDGDGVLIVGQYSDTVEVTKIAIFRTLDLADGTADTEQYFKVAEIANDHSVETTLQSTFSGTGVDDLASAANTIDTSVNIRVKIMSAGYADVTQIFHGHGLNDLHTPANAIDDTVDITIRVWRNGIDHDHYRVSTDGGVTYPEPTYEFNQTTCTYGNTTWHFNALTGHTVGNTWHLVKDHDHYAVSTDGGDSYGELVQCSTTSNTFGNTTWLFGAATGHDVGDYWDIKTLNANEWSYLDDKTDNDLTSLATVTNAPPPKAKFICLHKDRMFYANCPDEDSGKSLFMFSMSGSPECVPHSNYHYFDRSDGEEITGLASLPEALVVFKKNKIAVMEGDFSQWYTISNGIGCIAPWSIVTVGYRVYFISEEGWKATDGRQIYTIGKKLQAINKAGYLNTTAAANYTATYYPETFQILFNLYHASYNNIMMVAHLLESLYQDAGEEIVSGSNFVGWTYHEYDNHTFTCIGAYTDANGITRPIAGSSTGYLYVLDTGTQDVSSDISIRVETGWFDFGVPPSLTKTLRGINVSYSSNVTSGAGVARLYYDVDFVTGSNYVSLTKGGTGTTTYPLSGSSYTGVDGVSVENLDVVDSAVGQRFRFILTDTSANRFVLLSIDPYYRIEGRR